MTTPNLDELIARLEKATGPDRIIEHQIRRAKSGLSYETTKHGTIIWTAHDTIVWEDGSHDTWPDTPRYTASIDAALTLVPEGWSICLFQYLDEGYWECEIGKPSDENQFHFSVGRKTPALAVVSAALRARASSTKKEEQ